MPSNTSSRRGNQTRRGKPPRRRRQLVTINRNPHTFHDVVPDIFRTTVSTCLVGSMAAASASHNYFLVSGNSAHLPFASVLAVANQTVNTANIVAYSPEVYNTVQPQGFSNMCASAALYARYRVTGARIKVRVIPTSTVDNTHLCINTVQFGATPNTNLFTGASAPNSSNTDTYSAIESNFWTKLSITTAQAVGTRPAAIRNDTSYAAVWNASPSNEWCFVINYQLVSGAVSNGLIGWNIVVEHDIEFYEQNTGGLLDT